MSDARPGAQWAELARKLEDGGYATLFVPDHFDDQVAPLPAMAWAAAATSDRLRTSQEHIAQLWDSASRTWELLAGHTEEFAPPRAPGEGKEATRA